MIWMLHISFSVPCMHALHLTCCTGIDFAMIVAPVSTATLAALQHSDVPLGSGLSSHNKTRRFMRLRWQGQREAAPRVSSEGPPPPPCPAQRCRRGTARAAGPRSRTGCSGTPSRPAHSRAAAALHSQLQSLHWLWSNRGSGTLRPFSEARWTGAGRQECTGMPAVFTVAKGDALDPAHKVHS